MKVSRDEAFLISGGREFQRAWAATLKALSPNVLSLVWGGNGGEQTSVRGSISEINLLFLSMESGGFEGSILIVCFEC